MKSRGQSLLIGESFSPWTKKARWALEQCEIVYDYQEYTPTLSELGLRWRLRQWTGSVTVPVFFVGCETFRNSWEIARYANESTDGRLGDFEEIAYWNDLSEAALAEGRARVVRCIANNERALEESLPAFVPARMRRPMRFLARDAVTRLDRKYAHLEEPGAMRAALMRTREVLAETGSDYVLGRFSYADIAMAVVLEIVAPIAHTEPSLGPATKSCWNDPTLGAEFEDLLQWRDRLARADATSYSQFKSV